VLHLQVCTNRISCTLRIAFDSAKWNSLSCTQQLALLQHSQLAGLLPNTTSVGAIEQLDQPTLICTLCLARQHNVPRVICAAAAHLKTTDLSAEGVQALCDLPALPPPLWPFLQDAVMHLLKGTSGGNKKAAERLLLGVLSDLELVWSETDATRRTMLCQLPYHPLVLLLSADELQVATEDTVLFTVVNADAIQVDPAAAALANMRQRAMQKELLKLVTFPQLSAACLGTVVPELEGVKQVFDVSRLLRAAYACGRQVVGVGRFDDPPSWAKGRRTASSINSMTMLYEMQAQQRQQAAEKRAAEAAQQALDTRRRSSHHPESYNVVWCKCTRGSTAFAGRQWYVVWDVGCNADGSILLQLAVTAVFGKLSPHDGEDLPNPNEAHFPSAGLQVAVCGNAFVLHVGSRDSLALEERVRLLSGRCRCAACMAGGMQLHGQRRACQQRAQWLQKSLSVWCECLPMQGIMPKLA
jgi:hypothetical protein